MMARNRSFIITLSLALLFFIIAILTSNSDVSSSRKHLAKSLAQKQMRERLQAQAQARGVEEQVRLAALAASKGGIGNGRGATGGAAGGAAVNPSRNGKNRESSSLDQTKVKSNSESVYDEEVKQEWISNGAPLEKSIYDAEIKKEWQQNLGDEDEVLVRLEEDEPLPLDISLGKVKLPPGVEVVTKGGDAKKAKSKAKAKAKGKGKGSKAKKPVAAPVKVPEVVDEDLEDPPVDELPTHFSTDKSGGHTLKGINEEKGNTVDKSGHYAETKGGGHALIHTEDEEAEAPIPKSNKKTSKDQTSKSKPKGKVNVKPAGPPEKGLGNSVIGGEEGAGQDALVPVVVAGKAGLAGMVIPGGNIAAGAQIDGAKKNKEVVFAAGREKGLVMDSKPLLEDVKSKKVKVDLAVMSKCPDARLCEAVMEQVFKADKMWDRIELSVNYIGKVDKKSQPYGVSCMHGELECAGNIHQLCVQRAASNTRFNDDLDIEITTEPISPKQAYSFITTQNYLSPAKVGNLDYAQECAEAAGIDWVESGVEECVEGGEGIELLKASVSKMKEWGVTKSCTILIEEKVRCIHDGTWKECDEGHEVSDLVRSINKAYERLNPSEAALTLPPKVEEKVPAKVPVAKSKAKQGKVKAKKPIVIQEPVAAEKPKAKQVFDLEEVTEDEPVVKAAKTVQKAKGKAAQKPKEKVKAVAPPPPPPVDHSEEYVDSEDANDWEVDEEISEIKSINALAKNSKAKAAKVTLDEDLEEEVAAADEELEEEEEQLDPNDDIEDDEDVVVKPVAKVVEKVKAKAKVAEKVVEKVVQKTKAKAAKVVEKVKARPAAKGAAKVVQKPVEKASPPKAKGKPLGAVAAVEKLLKDELAPGISRLATQHDDEDEDHVVEGEDEDIEDDTMDDGEESYLDLEDEE